MSTTKCKVTSLLLVYLIFICQSSPALAQKEETEASYGTVSFGNSLGSENDDIDDNNGNVQWAFFEFIPGNCGGSSSKSKDDILSSQPDPFVRYVVSRNGTVQRIHQVGFMDNTPTNNETAALTCSFDSIDGMSGSVLEDWSISQPKVILSPQVGCHNHCSGRVQFDRNDPLDKMAPYSAVYDKGSLLCNNGDLFLLAGNLAYHSEGPNVKFFLMARSKATRNQTLDDQLYFKGLAGTFPSVSGRFCSLPFFNMLEALHSELVTEEMYLLEELLQNEKFNESGTSLRPQPLPPRMWGWGCGLEVSRPVQAAECPDNTCRYMEEKDPYKKGGANYPNMPQWTFLNFLLNKCSLDIDGLQPESLYVYQWDPNGASTLRPRSYSVVRNTTKCTGTFGYMSISRDVATNLKQVDLDVDFETCQGRATVAETIRSNAVVEESTITRSTDFQDAILLCNDGITFSLLAKRPQPPGKEEGNSTTSVPLLDHFFLNYAATSGDPWDDNVNGFTAARSFFPCESNALFCTMDLFETMTTLQSVLQNPKYFVESLWDCSGQRMKTPPNVYNNNTAFDNTIAYNSNTTKPPIGGDPTTVAPSSTTNNVKPSKDITPAPTPGFSYSITISELSRDHQPAPSSSSNNNLAASDVSTSNDTGLSGFCW